MTEPTSTEKFGTITKEKVQTFLPTGDEPKWLKQERSAAWELFLHAPMPTTRDEDWRQTDIESLKLDCLRTAESTLEAAEIADMPEWFLAGLKNFDKLSGVVAIADSKFWVQPLSDALTKQGVVFCDLKTAWEKHGDLVRKYFTADSPTYVSESLQSKFALLNRSTFNRGLFLYVPDNVVVDQPFVGLVSVDEAVGYSSVPRIFVAAAPHSKAQYVQAFLSNSSSAKASTSNWSLSNSLIEIYVGDGASLDYVEVQCFDEKTFAVGETHSAIARDGKFSALTVALGGGQVKSDIITTLQGRGAASKVLGVVLGDRSERFSFNTVQDHNAPDATSDINFRVALKGAASSIYQGIIRVSKIAQRTDAFQTNKNLLLGTEARADSIPRLEILADDVKCSHGATVGPVDREQIFYLMSRGLDSHEAEELVVNGFFRKVIAECPVAGVSDWIGKLVGDKISGSKLNVVQALAP
jgi:Fe-S cluster assembly protein SufD